MNRLTRVLELAAIAILGGAALLAGGRARQAGGGSPPAKSPSESSQLPLIEPQELVKQLAEPREMRPIVLQVGFEVLYRGAHIPGAIFAGPAARPEGLASLRKAAAGIPRDAGVAIYCGCCPMDKCPNIRPAYAALRQMGFHRVEVLDLPQDFARDWVEKGFPVERGSAR
jgi:3-mercaptopyruvate sulfurtransferase SseA